MCKSHCKGLDTKFVVSWTACPACFWKFSNNPLVDMNEHCFSSLVPNGLLLPNLIFFIISQDNNFKLRKRQEPAGNRWNMEAVLWTERSRTSLTTSSRSLSGRVGIWPEGNRKIRKFSGLEYCFHEITEIPLNRSFPCRTARSGL